MMYIAKEVSVAKSRVRLLCWKKSTIRKQLSFLYIKHNIHILGRDNVGGGTGQHKTDSQVL